MSSEAAKKTKTLDANEAVASVAYRASEVIGIFPITPASAMAEHCDEWAAKGRPNVLGSTPDVLELQSEAGAAGTVHGALQAGALATTFTASQGLLLMIPDMYKIAGELTAFCMHVAARTIATHALSIFGDHSDVMACRQTGFALLSAGSVQEAQDLALVAHAAALESRVPFLHFFDGFRTSHEIAKIETLSDDDVRALLDEEAIRAHRRRALTPDHPVLRGSAQNPDAYFQAREACTPFYARCPAVVKDVLDRFAARTGRRYGLFDYSGHPEAERVIVLMGSGAETAQETSEWLNARGGRTGVLRVRLFRPFSMHDFASALPPTVRAIAVLDRTKEPGAVGDPLFLDVVSALREASEAGTLRCGREPLVIGGRYGLSSKEFTPAMVKAVFDELGHERPRRRFVVGIDDDVSGTSLPYDKEFRLEPPDVVRALFFGLGSDGTVGANKNSIKIIGESTDGHAQGYFVYDSKKAGAVTVSHLRFGPRPIRSAYLIQRADFIACHHLPLLDRQDVLGHAKLGGTLLLNADPETCWSRLSRETQHAILERGLRVHALDAGAIARAHGLGRRVNTVMQVAFFALTDLLPREKALDGIRAAIRATYSKKGEDVVRRNLAAVDAALEGLRPVRIPEQPAPARPRPPVVPEDAPEFVRRVTAALMAGRGDELPVSAFPPDGTWPTGTGRWEKPALAEKLPVWEEALCLQCNKCALACPHAAIRPALAAAGSLAGAPAGLKSMEYRELGRKDRRYLLQVSPDECTGCGVCVEVCPGRDKADPARRSLALAPAEPLRAAERENWSFFLSLPPETDGLKKDVKGSQFRKPLFECSGACAGCGETPYVKLLTQLFGDRLIVANATGCSSIYGGNLPTTPYSTDAEGRGPAWSNSLFEDNAEFALGLRAGADARARRARSLLRGLAPRLDAALAEELLAEKPDADPAPQRERVRLLRARLAALTGEAARELERLADDLVPKTVWMLGGDGWAYDIGYGGLDHVLSSDRRVRALVLDTEVYSNTGGQQSKSTPRGAVAKFAAGGKPGGKKDLALLAMTGGNAYVARVALGAQDAQTVKALQEAEAYPGPALVIAYSPCVAHGYDLSHGPRQQKLAVDTGVWPLCRFDPRRRAAGLPALQLDSPGPRAPVEEYLKGEPRFLRGEGPDSERFRRLCAAASADVERRWEAYRRLAEPPTSPQEARK